MVDQLRSAAFLINTPTGPVRQSWDDRRAFAPVVVQLRAMDPEMDAVLLPPPAMRSQGMIRSLFGRPSLRQLAWNADSIKCLPGDELG
jgi:hypothetical protein